MGKGARTVRYLRFLGGADSDAAGRAESEPAVLLCEGEPLDEGSEVELVRRRSPWNRGGDIERVLIGSHPGRADVLLEASDILPEHARLYFPRGAPGTADLRVLATDSVWLNDRPVDPGEWNEVRSGDVLRLGSWRFMYVERTAG